MSPTPEEPSTEGPDDDDAASGGWIDPADRLWRHPSEVAAGSSPRATLAAKEPRRTRLMILIGAAAAAAAAACALILLSVNGTRPPGSSLSDVITDAPLTTLAGKSAAVPAMAEAAGQAMVQLQAETSHGMVHLVGVAVAEGGVVATVGADLSGLRSLSMVGANGELMPATLVAVDPKSDVALVDVPDDVPVAPFTDDVSLADGNPDLTLTVASAPGRTPMLHSVAGSVTGVGGAVASGPASGMPDITSSAVTVPETSGDLLLDSSGSVLGIFYDGGSGAASGTGSGATTDSASTGTTFLPTELVLGVADDLRSSGHVSQGWLGISGSDAAQGGASVAKVAPGSPAAGHLAPGDVIAEMNSIPIRSMADLRGRLYVMPPSTRVALGVHDGPTSDVVDVTLSASP